MKKFLTGLVCSLVTIGTLCTPTLAISLASCPEDENQATCEAEQAEILRRQEAGEPTVKSLSNQEVENKPTFSVDLDKEDNTAGLWMGENLLLMGNNLTTEVDVSTGLMLVAGNALNLSSHADYGFVAGNVVNFSGTTDRDLFIAGNMVTLEPEARIGRNVFVAASALTVKSDLVGDIAVGAERIVIRDVNIAGNVDITAGEIYFEGNVKVNGTLTYNDNAVVTGLNSNGVKIGRTETYHVEEVDTKAVFVAKVYGKIMSIAGLFLSMVLVFVLCSRVHEKVIVAEDASSIAKNLVIGLCVLIGMPVSAFIALCTVVAGPLALAILALYLIMIYLSQGFAGFWLGHMLLEKLLKTKANVYLEALLGITILSALSLVPYLGILTGFLGLLFGLGFIATSIKTGKSGLSTTGSSLKTAKSKAVAKNASARKKTVTRKNTKAK